MASLKNLVTGSSELKWGFGSNRKNVFVDGCDGKNVLMDWGHWKFIDVDGSNGQVVALGGETGLISSPGQSESLAFWGDPVGSSLVGVAVNILVLVGGDVLAVRVLGVNDTSADLFLNLRLFTGGAVRSSIAASSNHKARH